MGDSESALVAFVKNLPGLDDSLLISLSLAGKLRNMQRQKSEVLQQTLKRIQANAVDKPKKGKKSKGSNGQAASALPSVCMYSDPGCTALVDTSVTNAEAWMPGNVLRIGDDAYPVVLNPPTVLKLTIHGTPLVGFPLLPIPDTLYTEEPCTWRWLRADPEPDPEPAVVSTARMYTPTHDVVGCVLHVECTPQPSQQLPADATVTAKVGEVAIGPPSPHPRPDLAARTQQPTPHGTVRVVTYNILADQYASMKRSQKVLFRSCPLQYLAPDYRKQLTLQELSAYHGDFLALQEVDAKAFKEFYQPHLHLAGYKGAYTNKVGKVREGCATFGRASRWELRSERALNMREVFKSPLSSRHAAFQAMLDGSAALRASLQRVTTICQMTLWVPRHEADRAVLLLNTHLFYHPKAPHIRTMHVAAMMAEAAAFRQECEVMLREDAAPDSTPPCITLMFAGDFNSDLNDNMPSAVQLLKDGHVDAQHEDWAAGEGFKFSAAEELDPDAATGSDAEDGGGSEADAPTVAGVSVALPGDCLRSADDLATGYSNHVEGYRGLLDYVWYEPDQLEVVEAYGVPDVESLGGFLPSQRFPSDHLALVFDLRWRDPEPPGNVRPAEEAGAVAAGAAALRSGEVVAVPTDTLYGLACCANDSEAVRQVYAIKGRDFRTPLTICVGAVESVTAYGDCAHLPEGLLGALLPGATTLLLTRRVDAPLCEGLNPGEPRIGIRMPDASFVQQLCREYGGAVVLTSANRSGQRSTVAVSEFRELWGSCAVVFDAGTIEAGREGSTIIDLSTPGEFEIVRPGCAHQQTVTLLQSRFHLKERERQAATS